MNAEAIGDEVRFVMDTFADEPVRGVSGVGWLFVVLAVVTDLASCGAGAREGQRRGATNAA